MDAGRIRLRHDQRQPVRGEGDRLLHEVRPEEVLRVRGSSRGEDVRRRALADLRLQGVGAGEAVSLRGIERLERFRQRGCGIDRQRVRLRAGGRCAGEHGCDREGDGDEEESDSVHGEPPVIISRGSASTAALAASRSRATGNELPTAGRPRASHSADRCSPRLAARLANRTRNDSRRARRGTRQVRAEHRLDDRQPGCSPPLLALERVLGPGELEVLLERRGLGRVRQHAGERRHVLVGGEPAADERVVELPSEELRLAGLGVEVLQQELRGGAEIRERKLVVRRCGGRSGERARTGERDAARRGRDQEATTVHRSAVSSSGTSSTQRP